MSSASSYGRSFAMQHLAQGHPEKALAEAEKAIARDTDDPEPVLDRAQVLAALGRFPEAVADLEKCRELDLVARIVDDALLDDTLFSTLVSWGQALAETDQEAAVALLARYAALCPGGSHRGEVDTWAARFRGRRETWAKARPDEA